MDRRKITFAQAEGVEPLPFQLSVGEISREMRAKLWRVTYISLENSRTYIDYKGYAIGDPWTKILRSWHVDKRYQSYDEFDDSFENVVSSTKYIVNSGNYVEVLEFIQFIIRHQYCPHDFIKAVDGTLQGCRSAYRVIDRTIMPLSEPEEVEALQEELSTVRGSRFRGAYSHLQSAGSHLSQGEFASAVRESIHAVESACKQLEPEATTLGPALKKLESRGQIHPSLKDAFLKLYGYTSNEEGVRHSLVFKDSAAVDEADALFMFSSCAAFVGFLCRKGN